MNLIRGPNFSKLAIAPDWFQTGYGLTYNLQPGSGLVPDYYAVKLISQLGRWTLACPCLARLGHAGD